MNGTDTIRRQAEEIRALKQECRRLKQEARAYRRFYLKAINRYFGMLRAQESFYGFLEEHAADYPAIVDDPHAIVQTNGSEPLEAPAPREDIFSKCAPVAGHIN